MRGLSVRLPSCETLAGSSFSHTHSAQNMLVSAPGLGLSRLPCPRAGPGLGRHDRPRPAASTNVLCTDHPASVSH
eukprot:364283-Chlamydomonas_euryale.AAC.35